MRQDTSIAIIGAGIGGLTLAQALRAHGLPATLYERAPTLRAEGAGITMQVNAMRALDVIGLGDRVRRQGHPITEGAIMDASGRTLQRMDLEDLEARLGARGHGIHRGELVEVLARDLDPEALRLGAGLTGLEVTPEGVTLELEGGERAQAGLVIGADGIHSVTRRELWGAAPLRYAGYTTWRGIAPERDPGEIVEVWGGALRFGCVPIGRRRTYWFAVALAAPGGQDGPDVHAELCARFEGWPADACALIERTSPGAILRTDSFDRPPSSRWGRGPVTLLGDAAHPMTPNLGQGGGQAVEDAVVLADRIAALGPTPAALRAYERARRSRAHRFVERSWRFGQLAHAQGRLTRALRDVAMRWTPEALARRELVQMYDFSLPA